MITASKAIEHLFALKNYTTMSGDTNKNNDGSEKHEGKETKDSLGGDLFKSLKANIFNLIRDTKRLKGNALREKGEHLFSELMQCSIDVRKKLMKSSQSDFTPLTLACQIGNFKVADFFLDHCGANTYFTVYWAIAKREEEVLKYLLAKDESVMNGTNNLLRIASGILPSILDFPVQIKQVQNFLNMNWIHGYFNHWPSVKMLDILIENDAVEKCGKEPLFKYLTECITKTNTDSMNKDRHACFERILDRISAVDDIKNSDGVTILSFAQSNNRVEAFRKLVERGGELCFRQSVKILLMPDSSEETDGTSCITDNIDRLLDAILYNEHSEFFSSQYVHPVVHAADTKNYKFLFSCLELDGIPLESKLDAVELVGAFLAVKLRCYDEALFCWNVAMRMRMNKDIKNFTITPEPSTLHIMSMVLGVSPPPPTRTEQDPDFTFVDNRKESILKMLNLVIGSYNVIRTTQGGKLFTKKVNMQHRRAFGCQIEYQTEDELTVLNPGMENEILLNSCLMYERLVGYNSGATVDAYGRLAQAYTSERKLIPYVSLVTYCLPYFIKYMTVIVPRKYVRLMIRGLVHILSKKALRSQLDFETILKMLKCMFIVCFVPPNKDNINHTIKEEIIGLMMAVKLVKENG